MTRVTEDCVTFYQTLCFLLKIGGRKKGWCNSGEWIIKWEIVKAEVHEIRELTNSLWHIQEGINISMASKI